VPARVAVRGAERRGAPGGRIRAEPHHRLPVVGALRGRAREGEVTRVRFGLIGYGAWGRHHAAAIRDAPGLTLAGVACRGEASAAAAGRDLPGVAVYRDYRELLRDASIEAVDVVTPNHPARRDRRGRARGRQGRAAREA